MGIIRLLLALSVVSVHSNSHRAFAMVGGEVAVQAFYLISGFYVAMIYRKNYANPVSFWKSRYLRLFPVYLTCIIFAFFFRRLEYFESFSHLPVGAMAFIAFTNISMFFQDLVMFLGVNGDHFFWTKEFLNSKPPLFQLLLLPQGWSLGLELSFYFLAPFILVSRNRILILIFCSFLVRIFLIYFGLSSDPWSYRFFPSELALFLVGSLAFNYKGKLDFIFTGIWKLVFLFAIPTIILFFPILPFGFIGNKIFLYVILALGIGSVFELTKKHKFDNFLGMLSYPIYCCHLILILYILPQIHFYKNDGGILSTFFIFGSVVFTSICLYIFVEKPFDLYRMKFKRQSQI